jgi:hypothetical protein
LISNRDDMPWIDSSGSGALGGAFRPGGVALGDRLDDFVDRLE